MDGRLLSTVEKLAVAAALLYLAERVFKPTLPKQLTTPSAPLQIRWVPETL